MAAKPSASSPSRALSPSPASSNSAPVNSDADLKKQIWSHEVAIGELNSLSSSRAVYQKNGNLYFRTTVPKATAFEEKQLQQLKKLNSH